MLIPIIVAAFELLCLLNHGNLPYVPTQNNDEPKRNMIPIPIRSRPLQNDSSQYIRRSQQSKTPMQASTKLNKVKSDAKINNLIRRSDSGSTLLMEDQYSIDNRRAFHDVTDS